MPNYIFSASITPTDGRQVMLFLKDFLKSAGWTVPSSSNGTTFSAGDILSSSTDFGNNSWFILKQPLGATGSHGGVRRELAFQRSTTNTTWRAKYSYSSSFTGSANATTMPSAPDEVRILGSQFPGFGYSTWFTTDGAYKINLCADTEAPYSFYLHATGSGTAQRIISMDGLVSGTFAANDNDPYVFYVSNVNVCQMSSLSTGMVSATTGSEISTPACWTRKGYPDEGYAGMSATNYAWADNGGLGNNLSTIRSSINAYTGQDDLFPIYYYRMAGNGPPGGGFKGMSSLFKITSPLRNNGDTFSTIFSGSRDQMCIVHVAVPWNGTDPLI
jgi:hypothetical protein